MTKLADYCSKLAGLLVAVYPALVGAQSSGAAEFFQEFSSLLTHGNGTTEVALDQCILKIQTRVRTSCSYPTEPNWKHTTIDLREIKELELRPFRDGYVLVVEIDLPLPSRLKTLAIMQLYGEQAAFDFFSAESERLLNEHEPQSKETIISCTGETSERPRSRSIMLFLDDKPATWDHFEAIVQNCN